MHPFAGGLLPPRVNPTPNPAPTAPTTIPTVPQTPRCPPVAAGGSDGAPGSVSLPEATSRSRVACCGGKGAELSPLRTLVICPALAITQTPARLQTFTSPSNTITFMVLFALVHSLHDHESTKQVWFSVGSVSEIIASLTRRTRCDSR